MIPDRKIRGLRDPIPPGYLLGRVSTGSGDVELLNIAELRRLGIASRADVADTTFPDPTLVDMTAAAALSGHRVVKADSSGHADYPSINLLADAQAVIGITTGAIASGDTGPVQMIGTMVEGSWSWTPGGPIYCADLGVLTQVLPTGKWILQVATAITATSISIEPRTVISTP